MSELSDLEDVAAVTSYRVNAGSRPCHNARPRWSVSPNIERASVARERPAAPIVVAPSRPEPPTAVPRPAGGSLGRPFTSYRTLVEICRDRAVELQLSRLEIDRLAGVAPGYSSKILGKGVNGARAKRVWPIGLEALLGALGLRVLVLEDEVATARTLALRKPVTATHQRFGNKSNSARG